MAAYPVSAINADADSIVLAGVNLDWMSKIMSNLGGRPGVSGGSDRQHTESCWRRRPIRSAWSAGRLMRYHCYRPSQQRRSIRTQAEGSLSFVAVDGSKRAVSFARIAGTRIAADRQHRRDQGFCCHRPGDSHRLSATAGSSCLFVLLGALIAAEKLIIRPIEMMAGMAKRFGQGDWSVRAARNRLPAEFIPLARAFNAMAAQLAERERELVATNERLTVIASIDMLSGLANRRGFQSRLDFEWLKAHAV